jgi:hypothetical protein
MVRIPPYDSKVLGLKLFLNCIFHLQTKWMKINCPWNFLKKKLPKNNCFEKNHVPHEPRSLGILPNDMQLANGARG